MQKSQRSGGAPSSPTHALEGAADGEPGRGDGSLVLPPAADSPQTPTTLKRCSAFSCLVAPPPLPYNPYSSTRGLRLAYGTGSCMCAEPQAAPAGTAQTRPGSWSRTEIPLWTTR